MDFRNLFFVLFLKSRRTSTNRNLTHFVHLKISYGQAITEHVQTLYWACAEIIYIIYPVFDSFD